MFVRKNKAFPDHFYHSVALYDRVYEMVVALNEL